MSRGRPIVDIDVALRDPALLGAALGDSTSWETWLSVLRAASGLGLTPEQRARFDKVAGGRTPPTRRVRELVCVAGRGSGKTRVASATGTGIATLQRHRLSPGETGCVAILSPTLSQSRIAFGYCLAFLQESPALRSMIVDYTQHEIRLSNGTTIITTPASFRTIRGRTLLAVILDESAYFRSEESAVPDVEVVRACTPSLVRSNGMLISISTPYRKMGWLFERHRDFYGRDDDDVLVVQGSSRDFNPLLDEQAIAQASAADPQGSLSEWGGIFRPDIGSLLDDPLIDAAADHDRPLELPPRIGVSYHAFVDSSGGRGSGYAIAIGHLEKDAQIIDVVRVRASPLDPAEVTREYCELLRQYGITSVVGDAYGAEWTATAFGDNGIKYVKSEWAKSKLFVEGLPSFTRGLVKIPANHATLLRELRLLERRTSPGGQDVCGAGRLGRDDAANVLFGVIALLDLPKPRLRMWSEGPNGCEIDPQTGRPLSSRERTRIRWVTVDERGRVLKESY